MNLHIPPPVAPIPNKPPTLTLSLTFTGTSTLSPVNYSWPTQDEGDVLFLGPHTAEMIQFSVPVQEQAGCHPGGAERRPVTWTGPSSQPRHAEPALALLLYLHVKEESLKVKHGFHFFIKQSSGLQTS